MKLRFSARARGHLIAIENYIRQHNPSAAARVGERIRESTEVLRLFPYAGRPGRSENTHEWVVQGYPYILVYDVEVSETGSVTILGVFHCSQDPRNR